jgi:hypothetical protein
MAAKQGGSEQGNQPSGSVSEQLITERDVAELARKLEEWGATLAPAERALLTLIMSRAQSTETRVVRSSPGVGLSATQTRAWLTPWALKRNLSFVAGIASASDAFAKDTGPSWVDSPRKAAEFGGTVIEE